MGCGSSSSSGTEQSNKVKNQQDLKLNYDDFKDIDEHARQAPTSVEESIETLAKYLAKPAKNDIEVVRALYVWICENIRYDTNAYFGGNLSSLDTSGKGVLTSKSSVCAGYANLFESLCQALGISCKKISGYAKGYGHKPGDVITFNQKTNHAWNAVRLEGVWRFIETTWGAGHVDKNQEFIKEFNNYSFLTSPENFIFDHFPYFGNNIEESEQWQLLEKPISIEEYTKKIRPSEKARQYGVKFSSHPYEIILVNNSPCTIIVESSANPFQNCWFDLYDDKGSNCTEAAIMLCEVSKECKTTVRPPYKGKYTLCLHATIKDENTTLADYIISCGTAEPNWKPYPNYRGFYGSTPNVTERGFAISSINPCYTCKDGNFHLSLKTTSTLEVLVQLHDSENIDHKENLMVEQNDTSVNVRSRLLKKGYYKLIIFSKFEEEYTLAYTVLILNTGESDWKPFPKNTGHYGPEPDFMDRGFEKSDINSFYKCKDGKFHLLLKTTSTPELLVQLNDAEDIDHKDYLMVETNDSSINIRSRLLNKGYYKLTIFSKVDEAYTLAYTILILNTAESDVKSKFPITYKSTSKYKCQLFQPLVRELPPNSEICFEFTSPAFESILANKKSFSEKSGDKWKVTVTTGESGELSLSGKPNGESSYWSVYTFVINS
ncbi:kyphoscoliosis peptidase-like [Mytilus edulis]|uniref:kyphoscoliosis peptidase-like n=1 Tax=Mytilus edulis TaxID=6550 RepID=UPI0039F127F0